MGDEDMKSRGKVAHWTCTRLLATLDRCTRRKLSSVCGEISLPPSRLSRFSFVRRCRSMQSLSLALSHALSYSSDPKEAYLPTPILKPTDVF